MKTSLHLTLGACLARRGRLPRNSLLMPLAKELGNCRRTRRSSIASPRGMPGDQEPLRRRPGRIRNLSRLVVTA